ncbi:MAG: polyprenyl synthetase family protein [Verrucomicrobiales bacterium]|nr:polyprenyl synthetase family protein [Verrucomicrobiales bacterium]
MLAAHAKVTADVDGVAQPVDSPLEWEDVIGLVRPFLAAVRQRLEEQVEDFEPELVDYARYALANQGKQLRPALVGLSGEAAGGVRDAHITVAAIIEMVHLATLVHDDVMDDAEIRRQRPTLAHHCGNSTAILLGDCLFAHALTLAASFPTTEVCRRVAQATKVVCSGEIIQTERRCQFELTRSGYLRILRMKTAELFALSCGLGAHLTGAAPATEAILADYGMTLGTAYQVYDDCLDLIGSQSKAGKSLGTDLLNGKPTLPVIVALERAGAAEAKVLRELLADWRPSNLGLLLTVLQRYDAVAEAGRAVSGMCQEARTRLQGLPASAARDALDRAAACLADNARALTANEQLVG